MGRYLRSLVALVGTTVLLAACNGNGEPAEEPEPADGADVSVTGTDNLLFEPSELSADAGTITVELTSEEAVEHTFTLELDAGDETVVEAAAGETETGETELEAGSYVFYCEVPGHREAGMEGTLEVG